MRIGILTGGGDVPGLNPAIKAMVLRARGGGHDVVGIRRGWAGLLQFNPDDKDALDTWTLPLTERIVRTVARTGGTFLHTSRTNPAKVKPKDLPEFLRGRFADAGDPIDATAHVLDVVKLIGLDALVTIGGDDTLSYSVHLHEAGFPVVAMPKTMDNDVKGTDYCIGFSTAMTRSVELITNLRTPAGSHERIAVVELFGRNSGETALVAGYLSGADRVLICEVHFDIDKVCEFAVQDKRTNPSRYAMIVVSEGAVPLGSSVIESGEADAYGHRKLGGVGQWIGDEIKRKTGENIINQSLGYLMRAGSPDVMDLMVGENFGTLAADLVMSKRFGYMTGIREGRYTTVPFSDVKGGSRSVDVDALYDSANYKPRVRDVVGKPMFLY